MKQAYNNFFKTSKDKKIILARVILEYLMILGSFFLIPLILVFIDPTRITINNINTLYSMSGALFVSVIWIISSGKLKKVLYSLSFITLYIYMLIQYLYEAVLSKYFSIFDIYNIGEGAAYLNTITSALTPKFYLAILFGIIVYIVTMKIITYANKDKLLKNIILRVGVRLFITSLILTLAVTLNQNATNKLYDEHINTINELTTDDWHHEQTNYQKLEEFTDKKSVMSIVNLYYYFYLDINEYTNYIFNDDTNLEEINKYLENQEKSQEKNEYTGKLKDENIIIIMLESIDTWVVDEETMPTLKMMQQTGMNFTNHYPEVYSGGTTLSTEYTSLTGFNIPINYTAYDSMNNTYPGALPNLFQKQGYITSSVHANTGSFYYREDFHESWGFQNTNFLYDQGYKTGYANDTKLLEDEIYNTYIDKENKFMSFVITYSAHGPYTNNKGLSEEQQYRERAKITDDFLSELIKRLEADNLLDNTTLVLYGDHYAYLYEDRDYLLEQKSVEEEYERHRVPFTIWNNHMEHIEYDSYTGMNDILPTIANMFALDFNPNYYIGDDLFSSTYRNYLYFGDGLFIGEKQEDYQYAKSATKINNDIIESDYFKYKEY